MTTKVCDNCGNVLKENEKFCMNCGTKYEEKKIEDRKPLEDDLKKDGKIKNMEDKDNKNEEKKKDRVCQKCHNVLKEGELFCTSCGTKYEKDKDVNKPIEKKPKEEKVEEETESKANKKEEKICQKCHNVLKEDELFCTSCGTKYEKDKDVNKPIEKEPKEEKVEEKTESKANKKEEKNCQKCHNVLKEDELFCTSCGTKYEQSLESKNEIINNYKDSTIKEIKKERICKKCGKVLKDYHVFCTKCGTKYTD